METAIDELGQVGVKCVNYKLCKDVLPEWWLQCKGRFLCTNCDMAFGTWSGGGVVRTGKGELEFKDSIEECPICLDTNLEGVSFPNCNHFACISCMIRLYYGPPKIPLPAFPYDNTADSDEAYEAYCDMTIEILSEEEAYKMYPLLKRYHIECHLVDRLNEELEDAQKSSSIELNKCPQCRV